jgi:hypothetical protein
MLNLYTQDLFFSSRIKTFARKLLGRDARGPRAVLTSLRNGLGEIGCEYSLNRPIGEKVGLACVLSDVKTLNWAIGQKKKNRIGKIIAGPNIAITPKQFNGILQDPGLDVIIAPSQWVRDFYVKMAPGLAQKIQIWPAGVAVPKEQKVTKEFDFLIFNKLKADTSLFERITRYLEGQNYQFRVLSYGSFKQEQYFKSLQSCKNLIYFSDSESQGLAMFEAWARGVPSLVWDKGFFEYGGISITGYTSSPYLTEAAGERFRDFGEFTRILPKFLQTAYSPRGYVLENFTDKICAQKYLNLANV